LADKPAGRKQRKQNTPMEIYQQIILASFLTTLFGFIAGFFFHMFLARRQSRESARERQERVRQGLLMEVEGHHDLARRPWNGRMEPFSTEAWKAYKDEASRFAGELPDALRKHYVEVDEVNAIVAKDLQLGHGKGYLDESYRKQCGAVAESARRVIGLF
jgi:hypothetical protein